MNLFVLLILLFLLLMTKQVFFKEGETPLYFIYGRDDIAVGLFDLFFSADDISAREKHPFSSIRRLGSVYPSGAIFYDSPIPIGDS